MKKNILISCKVLIAFIITACAFSNEEGKKTVQLEVLESEVFASNIEGPEKLKTKIFTGFIYDVGPRFNLIKKSDLDKAIAFNDFITDEHVGRIVLYKKA
jgi:hypothetical protein